MEDRCGNWPRLAPTDRDSDRRATAAVLNCSYQCDSDLEQLNVATTVATVCRVAYYADYLCDSDTEQLYPTKRQYPL